MSDTANFTRLPADDILALSSPSERRIATLSWLAELERVQALEPHPGLEAWLALFLRGLSVEDHGSLAHPRLSGSVPASAISGGRRVVLGLVVAEILRACRLISEEGDFSLGIALAEVGGSLRIAFFCDSPAAFSQRRAKPGRSSRGRPRFGIARSLAGKLGATLAVAQVGAGFCAVIGVPLHVETLTPVTDHGRKSRVAGFSLAG